jgi:phospholipase C
LNAYTQAYKEDIPDYWAYATHFVLADHYFTSVHGPSLPNHPFSVAAQSGGVIDNPSASGTGTNCDGTPAGEVTLIDKNGNRRLQSPCFDLQTLPDLLQNARISWTYYSAGGGVLSLINHIRNGPDWQRNIATTEQFMTDARNGQLPAVS